MSELQRATAAINATDEQRDGLRRAAIALAGHAVYGPEVIDANPIPLAGQMVVHGLTGLAKIGDGVTPWADLPVCALPTHRLVAVDYSSADALGAVYHSAVQGPPTFIRCACGWSVRSDDVNLYEAAKEHGLAL